MKRNSGNSSAFSSLTALLIALTLQMAMPAESSSQTLPTVNRSSNDLATRSNRTQQRIRFQVTIGSGAPTKDLKALTKTLRKIGINVIFLNSSGGLRFEITRKSHWKRVRPYLSRIRKIAKVRIQKVHASPPPSDVLIFDSPQTGSPTSSSTRTNTFRLLDVSGQVLVEGGVPTRDQTFRNGVHFLRARSKISYPLTDSLQFKAGLDFGVHLQTGNKIQTQHFESINYDETYLKLSLDSVQLTAGAQRIIWGSVYESSPFDRLAVPDLRRSVLDDSPDRHRPQLAVRAQTFGDKWSADFVWIPIFTPAFLPPEWSPWSPVNFDTGEILGVPADATLSQLVRLKSFDHSSPRKDGGIAVKVMRAGRGLDFGFVFERVRLATPYDRINPSILANLDAGQTLDSAISNRTGAVFQAVYPMISTHGVSISAEIGSGLYKADVAYNDGYLVTDKSFAVHPTGSVAWAMSAELAPSDGDATLHIQFEGRHLLPSMPVIDPKELYAALAALDYPFSHGKWKLRIHLRYGINQQDLYVNPRLMYKLSPTFQAFTGYHQFTGRPATLGGYFERSSIATVGLTAYF